MMKFRIFGAVAALGLATSMQGVSAAPVRHRVHNSQTIMAESGDRPLTIGGTRGRGLLRRGDDIIAPGGFSAHGYGYPAASADDRREALNARIRASASGPYGYGVDALGGGGLGDDREIGGSNPYWGNGFNSYVGYNGVPTDLAFGPGFANRHLADHDPDDDDAPGPAPGELGYRLAPSSP